MFSIVDHIHEIGREEDEPRKRVRPRIIEVVLFPVHPENRSAEARREGTVLREIVDAAFSRRKRSCVVVPARMMTFAKYRWNLAHHPASVVLSAYPVNPP